MQAESSNAEFLLKKTRKRREHMKKTVRVAHRASNYITSIVLSGIIAVCVGFFLYGSGLYLHGDAIYAQLYKLDAVANSMREGALFPLYARDWYNGYEIFRYAPPTVYILIVMLSGIFNADFHISICIFYGVMAFVSMMGFFLFGVKQRKIVAAFFAGAAYLLLPSTFMAVILEGNLDIVMGLALIPGILYFLHSFITWKNRLAILPFSALFCLLVLSHYILAIAFGGVLALYIIVNMMAVKEWKFGFAAIGNILLLYVVMGYFLYPALSGGLLSKPHSSQWDVELSLGIPVLAVAVIGLVTTDRKRFAGFFLTIAFCVLSFSVMEPVRKLISSPTLQRSYWYLISITAILLFTLLLWDRLRIFFLLIALCVMVGEGIPLMLSMQEGGYALQDSEALIDDYLLAEAASWTDNRIALMDMATLGAFPQWFFSRQDVDTMFGWDYEYALTARNQMALNEAFFDGFYDYMFDRLLLYGNDTAVILKSLLEEGAYENLTAAAGRNGYEVVAENENAIVFKQTSVESAYGVITHYENLAIGDNAYYIGYIYPSFGYGASSCIEDYTIEELAQYHKLYLSGFTYREKEKAENMLKELSAKGTEVYIDMQHIPVNNVTGKNEFMDAYAQFVQFVEDFPVLENSNGNQFKLDFYAGSYPVWDTVYVSGCEDVVKETVYEDKSHLVYWGQNHDPNVTFMGFNLVYYYLTTHNQDLKRFLDEEMSLSSEELPQPDIVPIQIERDSTRITVHAQNDNVNCNIAGVDMLEADRIITMQENLFVVNQGDTTLRIVHTGHREGMALSIFGIIILGIMWIAIYVLLENNETYSEK